MRDVGERLASGRVLDLRAREDRRGAVAIELVDGEARSLEQDARIVRISGREDASRLVVVEPGDERLRGLGGVGLGGRVRGRAGRDRDRAPA